MSNSRMSTLSRTAFPIAFLFFVVSAALPSRPLQKRMASERVELNETSLRQSRSCALACGACRFRLCEYDIYDERVLKRDIAALVILPTRKGVSSYPWICSHESPYEVGLVKLTGEATVQTDDGNFVKVSHFRPAGLRNRFTPRIISALRLNAPLVPQCSGLAIRKSLLPDQQTALEGRCMTLPIRKYDVLKPDGKVKGIMRARGEGNCVGFRVTLKPPAVRIELHWTNQDDMDLSVTEPSGDKISYVSPRSMTGGYLGGDEAKGNCDLAKQERKVVEFIEWPSSAALRGEYEITVNHYDSCLNGGLEWFLFVDVDGANFFFETGIHKLEPSEKNVDIDTFVVVLSS